MAPIARRYALALFAILARPWTWMVLGFGLSYVGIFGYVWSRGDIIRRDTALVPVAVLDEPPAAPVGKGGDPVPAGGLRTMRDWSTAWSPANFVLDDRGARSTSDEPPGACPLLDQLPALERLWMNAPDMLSERGWRRIGEHGALELLSLPNVASPDAESRERCATVAWETLARLPGLRQLDLRGTGGTLDILLPPLPALERCAIGWGRLEENLRSLADHSPRLRSLGLETPPGFVFTPPMIESLRRMPALRSVSVAATTRADDEEATLAQIADLASALPGVRVLPGTYRPARLGASLVAWFLATLVPFVFWYMAGVILSTPCSWMLPRRLAPHLFWPMAASWACGGLVVGVARSVDVAWGPAVVLALFAAGLGAYGAFSRDLPGWGERVTGALLRLDVVGLLLLVTATILARPALDRWLLGGMPAVDVGLLAAAAGSLAWKLVRLGRLPRILAERHAATPPGLALDPLVAIPRERRDPADDWSPWDPRSWWLSDRVIDGQIAAPPPADPTGVGGFADMLRRQHSRWQVPLMVMAMFVAFAAILAAVPWIVGHSILPEPAWPERFMHALLTAFGWEGCLLALMLVATLWGQRRASLVVDFLRPVSRRDYWLGLRRAIARDLVLPALLGGGALASGVLWFARGSLLAPAIAATVFVGCVALVHSMILVLAITKWPLMAGTLATTALVAATAGSVAAVGFALAPARPADVAAAWLLAGAVLAAGVAIRTGVLRGLETRELA